MSGAFELSPTMDWSLTRQTFAVTAAPSIVLRQDVIQFALAAGPTAYVTQSTQEGHIGDADSTAVDIGADAWLSMFIAVQDTRFSFGFVFERDWHSLDQLNPLVRDGGDAGGWSTYFGLRWE